MDGFRKSTNQIMLMEHGFDFGFGYNFHFQQVDMAEGTSN